MKRSNKFFILSLLLCGLTLKASEEDARIERLEKARKQAAIIAEFQRTVKREENILKGTEVIVAPFLIPGQMMMGDYTRRMGSSAEGTKLLSDFKEAQYGRCLTCSALTCAMGCTAGTLCALGLPIYAADTACLTGIVAGGGYATTLCPCTEDIHSYDPICKRLAHINESKQKTK